MDRKALERFRLSTFGRMVMGVSHEVDNHLSVVLGFAELIQIAGGPEKKATDGAGKILAAGEKIGAIIRQFSFHVRPHAPAREPFLPADMVSEILLFARYDLGRGNVTLSTPQAFPEGLVTGGDRRDLALALLALLLNGSEAMAGTGGILKLDVARRDGGWEFTVSDEGPGIPADVLPRVFDEGFTTKPEPVNFGMGLAVARYIAEGMGGELALANLPSGGCVAAIRIP